MMLPQPVAAVRLNELLGLRLADALSLAAKEDKKKKCSVSDRPSAEGSEENVCPSGWIGCASEQNQKKDCAQEEPRAGVQQCEMIRKTSPPGGKGSTTLGDKDKDERAELCTDYEAREKTEKWKKEGFQAGLTLELSGRC